MSVDLPVAREAEILDLLRRAYNGGPLWFELPVDRADHFRWKYRDVPSNAQMLYTVDADDRVVRFMGNVHRRWLVQGQARIASDGMDLALDPAWQGRRLNRAFRPFRGRSWHPEVEFSLSWYTHPTDVHLAQTGDVMPLGNPIQTLVRPIGPGLLVPHRVQRLLTRSQTSDSTPSTSEPAAQASRTANAIRDAERTNRDRLTALARLYASYVSSVAGRRPAGASNLSLETVERFDRRFEDLTAVASNDFDLIQERSLDYLNWRFCDPRGGPFIVRAVTHGDDVLGYAATHIRPGRAWVADLLVLPGRDDVVRVLVEDALRIARRHRVPAVRARLAKRHPYRRAFRDAGFAVEVADAGLCVEPQRGDQAILEALTRPDARIHVTFADSDHV